ncbi:MAG: phosphoribosylglycinamide formyltransferase [Desulfobacteraceae bacterium]|jgi:phosphoribosylglycinamide formyltransferase-1
MARIKIGVLVSGGGSNLQAIMDACQSGRLSADVKFVGSDNPEAYGLERARKAAIPTFVTPYDLIKDRFKQNPDNIDLPSDFDLQDILVRQSLFPLDHPRSAVESFFKVRVAAENNLLQHINSYSFDLLVLAGFMRIFSPYFIDRINVDKTKPRIMNIHPALLPSFPGVDGYSDTFEHGCKVGGCTVHFVDYGEDTGPIIGQKSFDILPDDTLDSVRSKGLALEWQLFPECIRLFSENRLVLDKSGRKTVVKIIPEVL